MNRLDNEFLCFLIRSESCLVERLVDIRHSIGFSFVLECFDELFLRILGGHSGELFKLQLGLFVHFLNLRCFIVECFDLVIYLLLFLEQFVLLTLQFSLFGVELLFALLDLLFALLFALFVSTDLVIVLEFESDELLFCFNDFVLFNNFRFFFGFAKHADTTIAEDDIAECASNEEGSYTNQDCY